MEVKEESGTGVRCRCCYGQSGCWQPFRQHNKSEGPLEAYADMLHDTFSIDLCELKSEQICSSCVLRLRDASEFKRVVLDSEQRHLQLLVSTSKESDTGPEPTVKLEMEEPGGGEGTWETDYLDTDDYIEVLGSPNVERIRVEMKPEGVFRPVDKKVKQLLKSKSKPSKSKLASLISMASADKRTKTANIDTLKSLVGQPIGRSRPISKKHIKSRVTGKLLTVSKSKALVSKLLNPIKIKTEPGQMKMNVDSILKALSCKKEPKKRTITIKTEPGLLKVGRIRPIMTTNLGLEMVNGDRRHERQILKHNVIALVKFTTACPFIHHRSNFKCFYCGETFFTFDLLQHHVDDSHADTETTARKIYTFKDIVHVDISNLKCRKCGKPFPNIENIKDHLINEHKVKINMKHKDDVIQFKLKGFDKQNFQCHLCSHEFHVFRNLSLHMNEHFPNYMCEVCGKPFISSRRCQSHETTHQTGSYQCTKCDKVFPSLNSRNAHSMEHRVTKYRCPQCPERFNKYLERTLHMSEVHQVTQKFLCKHPQCGKEFIHKPQYAAHLRSHMQKEKKVECGECGMRFINNYSLSKHVVSHTGERPFQCRVCGKKYGRKNTLREHMRIHENDRRHVCSECGQAFVQKCSLNGHIKSRHPHTVLY